MKRRGRPPTKEWKSVVGALPVSAAAAKFKADEVNLGCLYYAAAMLGMVVHIRHVGDEFHVWRLA
jgi:hypothetical protein